MVTNSARLASARPAYEKRTIRLVGDLQRQTAIAAISNAPLDAQKPLEILIREAVKSRKPDQNALYWAGPLADIEKQAWSEGRRYSAEVWHEMFKREYLPEEHQDGITKEGYVKWTLDPVGQRVLIGSTTDLTVRGFSIYLEQVIAFGAQLGVQFGVREQGAYS